MSTARNTGLKLFAGSLLLLALSSSGAADSVKSTAQNGGTLFVDFADNRLTVHAQNVDANDLFSEITSKTGLEIVTQSPIDGQISVAFRKTWMATLYSL